MTDHGVVTCVARFYIGFESSCVRSTTDVCLYIQYSLGRDKPFHRFVPLGFGKKKNSLSLSPAFFFFSVISHIGLGLGGPHLKKNLCT